jgi:hypothetical protein
MIEVSMKMNMNVTETGMVVEMIAVSMKLNMKAIETRVVVEMTTVSMEIQVGMERGMIVSIVVVKNQMKITLQKIK